jgi:nicotinate-nucleotide--dimethylbenzimidazole phosphoribosyltransferase
MITLAEIIEGIKPVDQEWIQKAQERTAQLVMPTRALGRLHDISEQLCGIQETLEPSLNHKAILVMAGDHGVVEEGVSAYPQEVTPAMVQTFLAGGAGINAISRQVGADVRVVDMGVIADVDTTGLKGADRLVVRKIANGTANFTKGPAMSNQDAETAVVTGFQQAESLFEQGVDILGTGDMGIGNTTPAAAIGVVLAGASEEKMVGRGTGVDDAGLARKRDVVRRGIELNVPEPDDGLDVLAKVGGFEIGGIAGAILAAAFHQRAVAMQLGLKPVLDLGMRLGEGTGAALAMSVVEGAVCMFKEVLTFEEAGVANK